MDQAPQSLQALWLHAVDYRDARRRCCCEGGKHMTIERQIVNWLLGFVIGILTVLSWQKVMSDPLIVPDV
jgi:hypothetical protein